MNRKSVAVVMLSLMTVSFLGGCGDKDQEITTINATQASQESNKDREISDSDAPKEKTDEAESPDKGHGKESETDAGDGSDKDSENEQGKETLDAASENSVPEQDYEKLYEPVFSEIIGAINNGLDFETEYTYVSDGLFEKIMYPGDADLLKDVGYCFNDFSKDGVPELLIGTDENYSGDDNASYIYGIYALKDGKPIRVVGGSTRSSYRLMNGGHFCYQGSGGAMITIIGENHLSTDGQEIIWDDFYFTDEKSGGQVGIYYNTTGLFDANESKELDISQEKFSKIMNGYDGRCVTIDWTPIGHQGGLSGKNDDSTSSASQDATGWEDPDDYMSAEVSYEGNSVTINGITYNMSDYAALCNAVMGYTQSGSWIIVEGHINPHVGVYEFYNLGSRYFEYEVLGANLTMWENDISTAVYSNEQMIYDICGNTVAWADGEVYSLEYKDDHTLVAEIIPLNDPGAGMTTQEYDFFNYDHAMFDYYTALVSGDENDWAKFYSQAPQGAYAFVMENPPERFLWNEKFAKVVLRYGGAWSAGTNASETIVAVSLQDGMLIKIQSYELDSNGENLYASSEYPANRGEPVPFEITVIPEGLPIDSLCFKTTDQQTHIWDVTPISGEHAQRSRFLSE